MTFKLENGKKIDKKGKKIYIFKHDFQFLDIEFQHVM